MFPYNLPMKALQRGGCLGQTLFYISTALILFMLIGVPLHILGVSKIFRIIAILVAFVLLFIGKGSACLMYFVAFVIDVWALIIAFQTPALLSSIIMFVAFAICYIPALLSLFISSFRN